MKMPTNDYDRWKTTPPHDEFVVHEECPECTAPIFDGENIAILHDDEIVHEDCVKDYLVRVHVLHYTIAQKEEE